MPTKQHFTRERTEQRVDGQRVWGVVFQSLDPDPDGSIAQEDIPRIDAYRTFIRHDALKAMAEEFTAHYAAMDSDHSYAPGSGRVAQSVVLEKGEALRGFPDRAWVLAAIPTEVERAKIQSGEHKSFSMATVEERIPRTLTVRETGEKIEVEEIQNPHCMTVSFVQRGANGQQVTLRSDGVWGKIREIIGRVAGERGTDLMEDWPRRKFWGSLMDLFELLQWTTSDIVYDSDLNGAGKAKAIKQAFADAGGVAVAAFLELDASTQETERSDPDKTESNPGAKPDQTTQEDPMDPKDLAIIVDAIRSTQAPAKDAPPDKVETPAADPKDAVIAALTARLDKLEKATPAPTNLGPSVDRSVAGWQDKIKAERRVIIEVPLGNGLKEKVEFTGIFHPLKESDIVKN